jgi:hypothetical protein
MIPYNCCVRNMVKKLREALDRPFSPSGKKPETIGGTEASSDSKARTFEEFLAGIQDCNSIVDAKRIRNHIVVEIRKRRLQISKIVMTRNSYRILLCVEGHKKGDYVNGKKVSDLEKYINRLFVAKKRAEKRILTLGGTFYRTVSEYFNGSFDIKENVF